ncbi:MAG: energy transducer TonB [Pseudomonadota bacterium]
MQNNKLILFFAFAWLLGPMATTTAQEDKIEVMTVVVPPKPIKRGPPTYPIRSLQRGIDGWVEVNMMVDDTGKPFEVMVLDSSSPDFERTTISTIQKWRYEPAVSNGKPVMSSLRTIMWFEVGGSSGAHRAFVVAYRQFFDAFSANATQDEAKALLTTLEATGVNNRYESAFFGLANFLYASRFGTSLEQMNYLGDALSNSRVEEDEVFLPANEAKFARHELIKLQVRNRHFKEAQDTYSYFEQVDDKEALETFKPLMDEVAALKLNDDPYEIPAAINDKGEFSIKVFKNQVYVAEIEGKVDEFKVYCEKQYLSFAVEPDIAYDIPEQWGVCTLTVAGTAGTTMKLGQL